MVENELKTPKSYSLDPVVIAWVMQKAARRTIETGAKISDSQIVNDILTEAMEEDKRTTSPKITVPALSKRRADSVAA